MYEGVVCSECSQEVERDCQVCGGATGWVTDNHVWEECPHCWGMGVEPKEAGNV